jgi:hypothetical protein
LAAASGSTAIDPLTTPGPVFNMYRRLYEKAENSDCPWLPLANGSRLGGLAAAKFTKVPPFLGVPPPEAAVAPPLAEAVAPLLAGLADDPDDPPVDCEPPLACVAAVSLVDVDDEPPPQALSKPLRSTLPPAMPMPRKPRRLNRTPNARFRSCAPI